MMMKRAIILTSFGSTNKTVREITMDYLAEEIRTIYKDYEIRQAYTSKFIVNKLKSHGININSLEEEIKTLEAANFDKIIILPTHLTPSEEFENKILPYCSEKIQILNPLFSLKCDSAFDEEAFSVILECFKTEANEEFVLIGHGSPNRHNPVYENLQRLADEKNFRVHIGVIEQNDYPNFEDVSNRLQKSGVRKVLLAPMLFNGGTHIGKEIAGEGDSWKNRLKNSGYEVRTITDSLGTFKKFRNLYIKRLKSEIIS